MSIATGFDGPSGASVVSETFDSRFSGVHVTGTLGSLRTHRNVSKDMEHKLRWC